MSDNQHKDPPVWIVVAKYVKYECILHNDTQLEFSYKKYFDNNFCKRHFAHDHNYMIKFLTAYVFQLPLIWCQS